MLEVPEEFNRNHINVQKMADPADTGRLLIDLMCSRIGIDDLNGLNVLDFGCGVRFTQAIINRNIPIGTYTGLEVESNIIGFLSKNVKDPRFSYHLVNHRNQYYNPDGQNLDPDMPSPIGSAKFDLACMFSVITHQQPEEAKSIFKFLSNHIFPGGYLFFSAFIHDDDAWYCERDPDIPGHMSSYSLQHMTKLLEDTNWSVISVADPYPKDVSIIMTSFLCKPVTKCHPLTTD